MEKTISNMLKADYSTPQSLHRLEPPRPLAKSVTTSLAIEDTLHNNYRAFTRNLKIAPPQQMKEDKNENEGGLEDLIDDIYAYNYAEKPPEAESDYEKLKKAHKHLLDTYFTNKEQLLTMLVQLQKLQILLTLNKKERFESTNVPEIQALFKRQEKRFVGLLESVIKELNPQQASQIFGKLAPLL